MIYTTNNNSIREIFFEKWIGSVISTIDVVDDSEGFDSILYEWSWSLDQSTWSAWSSLSAMITEMSQQNLSTVNVWMKVRLTAVRATYDNSHAWYELQDILVNTDTSIVVDNIQIVEDSNIVINTRTKNLFRPYKNSEYQKALFGKMSRAVSDIFSFTCTYFRVIPDADSGDMTFKTFTLNNVAEYRSMEIVIRNNDIPYDRLMFSEFDIDFQDDFEIHIVKEVFKEVFGEDAEPSEKDFLFLPLTNRMYEVNSTGNGALFFNESPYWAMFLVKYENRASVKFNKKTSSFEEMQEIVDFDYDAVEPDQQNEKDASTLDYALDEDDNVSDDSMSVDNIDIFRYAFDFSDTEANESAQTYAFDQLTEFGLALWVNVNELLTSKILSFELSQTEVLSISTNGVVIDVDMTGQSTLQLTTAQLQGNEIQPNTYIGLCFNWLQGSVCSLSVYNNNLELIQEIAESNIITIGPPSSLSLKGGMSFANIRLMNKIITQPNQKYVLSSQLPTDVQNYVIIDNAVPKTI